MHSLTIPLAVPIFIEDPHIGGSKVADQYGLHGFITISQSKKNTKHKKTQRLNLDKLCFTPMAATTRDKCAAQMPGESIRMG